MIQKTVYTCGPITGLSYGGATEWRETIRDMVDKDVKMVSPMRGKDYFKHVEKFEAQVNATKIAPPEKDAIQKVADLMEPHGTSKFRKALSSAKGILARDSFDVRNCDILLMNVLGAKEKSLGSICEMAWAWQFRKPIILVIEEDLKNPHTHDFTMEMVNYVVHDLPTAANLINAIFKDY